MPDDMKLPPFLQNQSVEEIHGQMLSTIPDSIGKEENGWVSDMTLPTAIQKAEIVQYKLVEILKSIFPKYANYFLDEHAETRGIQRRKPEYAKGLLSVKGKANTCIPKGFLFSTASTLDASGVIFISDNETIIPESGTVIAPVTAQSFGVVGNVAAEAIVLMVKPLTGIMGVSNAQATYGGFEEESDESLKKRMADYDAEQGLLFVGSPGDYERWAYSVPGVGNVKVLSATDDSGLVSIIVTDLNGEPAGEAICHNIYNYIMRPDSPSERPAPINALLRVVPPVLKRLSVAAVVTLESGYTIEGVIDTFVKNTREYLKTEDARWEVKYTEIGGLLIQTDGIADYDFQSLSLNGDKANVAVGQNELPSIESTQVVLTQ